jgi:hypothetical protein
MHRALAIPDVLLHIVSHVEAKDTLAALARTSSVVSGCALDKLWHTIDSVVLLARCMPSDLWDEVETCVSIQYGSGVGTKHSSQLVRRTIELAAFWRLVDVHSLHPKIYKKAIGLGRALTRTRSVFGTSAPRNGSPTAKSGRCDVRVGCRPSSIILRTQMHCLYPWALVQTPSRQRCIMMY